jgi:hypothetical protein
MSKPYFDRWALGWGRTLAYRLFKRHHTQLNSLYWAHAAALRFAFSATRKHKREDPTTSLFSLPGNDITRINYSLGGWADNYEDFDNWVRLNALVGITGYLEVYLKTVTRLALESDPGLLLGAPHAIDGVRLLKMKKKYSYAEDATPCVRGTWHQRLAHYRRLFGHVPQPLERAISELEKLRKIRNGVTHTFGRSSDDYVSLINAKPKPLKKVKEEYLKKTLARVDDLAVVVDEHLGVSHVGEYETLYFYHHWDKQYDKGRKTEEQALGKQINTLQLRNRSPKYYSELIAHYKAA